MVTSGVELLLSISFDENGLKMAKYVSSNYGTTGKAFVNGVLIKRWNIYNFMLLLNLYEQFEYDCKKYPYIHKQDAVIPNCIN